MNNRNLPEHALTITVVFDLAADKGLTPRAWTWKPLQAYNGFVHDQRVRKWQAINLGIKLGFITPANHFPCDICGAKAPDVLIMYHSEDYSSMTGHYPLCKSCHTRTHGRFNNQGSWLDLISNYGDGTKWFENLKISQNPI